METFSSGATGDVAITMLMHEDVLDPTTWSRTSAGTALGQSGVVDEVRTGDQYWSRSAGGDWASMPLGQAISDRPWLLTNVAVDLSGTKIDGATIKTKTAGDACAITVQLPRYPDVSISLTFLGADPLPNTIGILSTAGSQTKVGKDAAPTDVDSVIITINPGDVAPIVAPIAP